MKNMWIRRIQVVSVTLGSLWLAGCTLSPPSSNSHLVVSMPAGGLSAGLRHAGNLADRFFVVPGMGSFARTTTTSGGGGSNFPPPQSLSDFACVAVVVTAPDLPADPTFQQACGPVDASGNPLVISQIGGFASVNGGTIDLSVKNGSQRTFQLMGVQYSGPDCPSIQDVMNQQGSGYQMGPPFLLASTTQDIAGDASIEMDPSFTAGASPAFNCSNGGGSGQSGPPTLGLFTPANSQAAALNIKNAVSVFWGGPNGPTTLPPPDPFNLVVTGITGPSGASGTVTLCSDPTCSGSIVQPLHFDANGNLWDSSNIQIMQGFGGSSSPGFLGFKSTYPVGTQFQIQPQPLNSGTWTGWNLQGVQFTMVAGALTIPAVNNIGAGTCYQMAVTSTNSLSLANQTFNVHLQGGMTGATQAKVYLDSACTQALTVTSTQPWETVYSYTTDACTGGCTNGGTNSNTATNTVWFWISDQAAEGIDVSVTTGGDTFAPAVNMYNFTPNVATASPTSGTGGGTLTLTGAGFAQPVDVRIGNFECPVTSVTPTQITCTIPSGVGSSLMINVYQRGASYPAPGFYFSYTGFEFMYPSPTIHAAIGYPFPGSPIVPGVNASQAIVTASCGVSTGTLPSGVTLGSSDCSLAGSTVLDPSQPLPYVSNLMVTATGPSSATYTAPVAIEVGNFPIISYSTGSTATSYGMGNLAYDGQTYTLYIQSGATLNNLNTINDYGAPISSCLFSGSLLSSGLSVNSTTCTLSGPVMGPPGTIYSGTIDACSSVAYASYPASPGDCLSTPFEIQVQ